MTKGQRGLPSERKMIPYYLIELEYLGGSATAREVSEKLAKRLKVGNEQLKKKRKRGDISLFELRVHFIRFGLARAGYLENPSGSTWSLSKKGKEIIPNLIKWDEESNEEKLQKFTNIVYEESKKVTLKEEKIGLPTQHSILPYYLIELDRLGGSATVKEVSERLAQRFRLSNEQLKKKRKRGDISLFEVRVHFTKLRLSKGGYLENPSGSTWRLSKKAKEIIPDLVEWDEESDEEELEKFTNTVYEESERKSSLKEEKIGLPTQYSILPYYLIELDHLGGRGTVREISERLAQRFRLSDEQLRKKRKRGDISLFEVRVHFTKLRLSQGGYLENLSGSIWSLSKKGKEVIPGLVEWDEESDEEELEKFTNTVYEESERKAGLKEEKIGLPTQYSILPYYLIELDRLGGSATVKEVSEKLVKRFRVSDEQLRKKRKRGDISLFEVRVHFTKLRLSQGGYLENLSGSIWSLSKKGKEVIPDLVEWNEKSDEEELEKFTNVVYKESERMGKRIVKQKDKKWVIDDEVIDEETYNEESAREQRAKEQLNKICEMKPKAFEDLCKNLFEVMGYKDVGTTKKGPDGGIDGSGVLTSDLASFKIVFQAKKWKTTASIRSTTVRELCGSMQVADANKAVLITTCNFTGKAVEVASKLGIKCVNGEGLLELLQEYRMGYSEQEVTGEYQFHPDYFDKF